MSDRWRITIEAWPHSTGNGQDEDQKLAGERIQHYTVRGVSIDEALEAAKHIATGMRSNPMVWRAPITEIVKDPN
jgi:hypothetical protein